MVSLNNSLGSIEGGEREKEESKCHLRALVKTTAMDREVEGGGKDKKRKCNVRRLQRELNLFPILCCPLLSRSSSGHRTTPSELNLFPIPKRSHRQSTEFSPCYQLPFCSTIKHSIYSMKSFVCF